MHLIKFIIRQYSFDDIWKYLRFYFDPKRLNQFVYDEYKYLYEELVLWCRKDNSDPLEASEIVCGIGELFQIDGAWDLYLHTVCYMLDDIYSCDLRDVKDIYEKIGTDVEKSTDYSFKIIKQYDPDKIAQKFPKYTDISLRSWNDLPNMYVENSDIYKPEMILSDLIYQAGRFGKEYSIHELNLENYQKRQEQFIKAQKKQKKFLYDTKEIFKDIDNSFDPNEDPHDEKKADYKAFQQQINTIEYRFVIQMIHMFKKIQDSKC